MATKAKPVSVDAFMAALEHPQKQGIERLRTAIRALDPAIAEEIKWNAPSFRLADHFATFRLNPKQGFQLILHTGAKKRADAAPMALDDPSGLAQWAAPDRCVITFASDEAAEAGEAALCGLVRQWIAQL